MYHVFDISILPHLIFAWDFPVVKNLAANAGDTRGAGLIPGSGKSPGGMATQSSILAWRITMDRGAWWAIVHGVAKSQT